MAEPTVAELLRLDELLAKAKAKEGSELRFRRLYAAYAIKFDWPFCDDGRLVVKDSEWAWRRWASLEEKYSL